MKLTIVGTGYVGLVTGTCFAELGNEVWCVDIDEPKINNLNQGKIPIYEPGLEELVHRNQKEGRLHFGTDFVSAVHASEIVFSAVGTPPNKNHEADLTAVKTVAKQFGQCIEKYTVFVNKSTVPVGTSEEVAQIIQQELENRGKVEKIHEFSLLSSGQKGEGLFSVVDNPEFLREGAAVKDFLNPDRIVVGTNSSRALEAMEHLYRPLIRNGNPLIATDIRSAEIIKYASNAFLATKISFINEVAQFCEEAGGNVREIARGIGLDDRIGPRFLHAGIGYGGSCFPKDVKAFIQSGKKHHSRFQILEAVEAVNEIQKRRLFEKMKAYLKNLQGKTIAVWGLAFKPKTDDMREAPSLTILPLLIQEGANIQAFDPVAIENAKKILGTDGIQYTETAMDALRGADALMILTEWDEFRGIDPQAIKKELKAPLIFDGRNIYPSEEMEKAGIHYIDIGRKT